MKYGIIVTTPIKDNGDLDFINIGDQIQALNILSLYEEMGIPTNDIVYIEFRDIPTYNDDYLLLPININLSLNWVVNIFPLPSRIIPVFLGLSFFASDPLPVELKEYFRKFEPIGCRDEATLITMRKNGINAFLYGCVSLLLPRRQDKRNDMIYMVDVPESFIDYAHEWIETNSSRIVFQSHIVTDKRVHDVDYAINLSKEYVQCYKDNASLVISSRLHCIAPCVAMGIPVIAVSDNISPRMSFIDKFVTYNTPEMYASIDFEGTLPDSSVEYIKDKMRSYAIIKIKETANQYLATTELSFFWENRSKSLYGNYYYSQLKKINMDRINQYIIWGAGQIGMNVVEIVEKVKPDAKLNAVIDSYCEGTFHGLEIQRPQLLRDSKSPHVFVLVTTYSGQDTAKSFLLQLGYKEYEDFLLMGTMVG